MVGFSLCSGRTWEMGRERGQGIFSVFLLCFGKSLTMAGALEDHFLQEFLSSLAPAGFCACSLELGHTFGKSPFIKQFLQSVYFLLESCMLPLMSINSYSTLSLWWSYAVSSRVPRMQARKHGLSGRSSHNWWLGNSTTVWEQGVGQVRGHGRPAEHSYSYSAQWIYP